MKQGDTVYALINKKISRARVTWGATDTQVGVAKDGKGHTLPASDVFPVESGKLQVPPDVYAMIEAWGDPSLTSIDCKDSVVDYFEIFDAPNVVELWLPKRIIKGLHMNAGEPKSFTKKPVGLKAVHKWPELVGPSGMTLILNDLVLTDAPRKMQGFLEVNCPLVSQVNGLTWLMRGTTSIKVNQVFTWNPAAPTLFRKKHALVQLGHKSLARL